MWSACGLCVNIKWKDWNAKHAWGMLLIICSPSGFFPILVVWQSFKSFRAKARFIKGTGPQRSCCTMQLKGGTIVGLQRPGHCIKRQKWAFRTLHRESEVSFKTEVKSRNLFRHSSTPKELLITFLVISSRFRLSLSSPPCCCYILLSWDCSNIERHIQKLIRHFFYFVGRFQRSLVP